MIPFPICYHFQQHSSHSRHLQLYVLQWLSASLPTTSALIRALFYVAAAISQLEVVSASLTSTFFSWPRTWRQLISRHSQNQTQLSWVLFGLVPEAVWQHRKFFSKTILCWPSCISYNYFKSISPASNYTSTTPTDCCFYVCWALTGDLWLGTKLWNINLNNCEEKRFLI